MRTKVEIMDIFDLIFQKGLTGIWKKKLVDFLQKKNFMTSRDKGNIFKPHCPCHLTELFRKCLRAHWLIIQVEDKSVVTFAFRKTASIYYLGIVHENLHLILKALNGEDALLCSLRLTRVNLKKIQWMLYTVSNQKKPTTKTHFRALDNCHILEVVNKW